MEEDALGGALFGIVLGALIGGGVYALLDAVAPALSRNIGLPLLIVSAMVVGAFVGYYSLDLETLWEPT